jgi:malic enzyme
MDNSQNNKEDYLKLLQTHMGIFSLVQKFPVRDRNSLSLVYTPGVGASCKEIEKDLRKAYKYTNKGNSMLIISDSTGFKDFRPQEFNNMQVIPYLESASVYYKNVANIDCYPLVLDFNLIKNGAELAETVKAIMPAYAAVEFFNIDEKRVEEFYSAIEESKLDFSVLGSKLKENVEKSLKSEGIHFSANYLYAGILRAALDTVSYGNIDKCIPYVLENLKKENIECNKKNYFQTLELISKYAAEYFISHKISQHKLIYDSEITADCVVKKFRSYVTEGKSAWIGKFPLNYFSLKHSINENSLLLHERYRGVIETNSKLQFKDPYEMERMFSFENLDYISEILRKNPELSTKITCRSNLAGIITNGTAILGFGDIGTLPGLPVMEGKSVLFKSFGGTDVIPLCVFEKNVEKLIMIVRRISPIFSCINLEDIKAPDCFEVETRLNEVTPYPVFHDDQHGTAIVVLSAIINSMRLTKQDISRVRIVINGAGAAGLSVTELLLKYGAKDIIICDTEGAIYTQRPKNMNSFKERLALLTNTGKVSGKLPDVLKGANIFIGLSAPKAITQDMIKTMAEKPMIFALANPTPEIYPDEAKEAGAYIIGTGRSDFKNQINNSLAFPGIFRGAIDVKAKNITVEMKLAAAIAVANILKDDELSPDNIIVDSLDTRVAIAVACAVARTAIETGQAREKVEPEWVEENIEGWILEGVLKNLGEYYK